MPSCSVILILLCVAVIANTLRLYSMIFSIGRYTKRIYFCYVKLEKLSSDGLVTGC